MGESALHQYLKARVADELAFEGYLVFHEPLFPPSRSVHWSGYRPDIFGIRKEPGGEDYVVVECETRPNMKRLGSKNVAKIWIQSKLLYLSRLRKILAVPAGKLGAVDLALRKSWEIWVVQESIFRIPSILGGETDASGAPAISTLPLLRAVN